MKEEEKIQAKFVAIFNNLKAIGALHYTNASIIMQHNNSFSDNKDNKGVIRGVKAKAMGRLKGVPDTLIIYGDKRAWVEFKTPHAHQKKNNGLTEEQQKFIDNEKAYGIPCYIVSESTEVYRILKELNVFSGV